MSIWARLTERLQGKDLQCAFLPDAANCLTADGHGASWEESMAQEVDAYQEEVIESCAKQIGALQEAQRKLSQVKITPLQKGEERLRILAQNIEECKRALGKNE